MTVLTYLYMQRLGPDVVSLVRLMRAFDCWISFALILSCMCLSPNICFISFLYLNLYVLGNDVSIQSKHLCVLIHIRIKDVVGTFKYA